jgi:hypothetical protein
MSAGIAVDHSPATGVSLARPLAYEIACARQLRSSPSGCHTASRRPTDLRDEKAGYLNKSVSHISHQS